MGHEIVETENGALFVGRGERKDWWHQLGEAIVGLTLQDAQRKLRWTDFTFEKVQPQFQVGDRSLVAKECHLIKIAPDDLGGIQDMGEVSRDFGFVDHTTFFDAFNGFASKYTLDAGGVLKNGMVAFLTLQDESFDIVSNGKSDEHNGYWIVLSSLVKGFPSRIFKTSRRVVCWNTVLIGIAKAVMNLSMSHTASHEAVVKFVGKSLGASASMAKAYHDALQMMANKPIGDMTSESYFKSVFKMPEPPKSVRMIDNIMGDQLPAMMKMIGGNVQDATVIPEDIQVSYDRSMYNHERAVERIKLYREASQFAYQGMIDQGYGATVYSAFQAVGETLQHLNMGRGDVGADLLMGNRNRLYASAATHAMELVKA